MDFEEQVKTEKMRAAIAWHLANNFMPPQPPELLEYAIGAIEACSSGDCTRLISLPGGVNVTAGQLVDDLRLEDMVDAENSANSNVTILGNAQGALTLLIEADELAIDLSNRGLLDYKKSSAMATYFLRAIMPLRELIEYLGKVEKELPCERNL